MPERGAEQIRLEIAAERQRLAEDVAELRREAKIVIPVAAAALVAAGQADVFREGAALAAVSIDTGAARAKAEALARFTQNC